MPEVAPQLELPLTAQGERFDQAIQAALAEAGREVSASEVRRALKAGLVLVNGRRVAPGARAKGGEQIGFQRFVPRSEARVRPEPALLAQIEVLFEDEALLVLNKPSGIATHPLVHDEPGTLLGAAVAHAEEIATAGPPLEGGLVHRLDRGTSGVVVFARTAEARAALRAAFGQGLLEKRYRALVHDPAGALAAGLVLEGTIGRSSDPAKVCVEGPDPRALSARTEVVAIDPRRGPWAWVELRAHTGRRHQIRAHLAWQGAPIAGDPLYGPDVPARPGLTRLALHASRLVLLNGRVVEAPLPPELMRLEVEDRV